MSAPVKGTAQIAREVVADAVDAVTDARAEGSTFHHDLGAGLVVLAQGFQKIDRSLVIDIELDERVISKGLILANDRAGLYVPIILSSRAVRIDRSSLGKIEIVVPRMVPDDVERLIAALGSVVEDFIDWSRAAGNRNGRVRQ